MKRNISLLISVLITTSIFTACEKEGNKSLETNKHESLYDSNKEIDYSAYIDNLISTTGIDIYEVSRLDEIHKLADKNLKLMDVAYVIQYEKGTLTQSKLTQIQDLAAAIQTAYDAGDNENVLVLYSSLCSLCVTIDGFVFDVNEYGLQTVTYDPDKAPLQLPMTQMQAEQRAVMDLKTSITTNNPTYSTLPIKTQDDILTAAVYLNLQKTGAKVASVQDCIKNAKASLAWSLSGLTVAYIAGAALCAGTFLAILACEAVAYTSYISGCATVISLYNARVQLCNS